MGLWLCHPRTGGTLGGGCPEAPSGPSSLNSSHTPLSVLPLPSLLRHPQGLPRQALPALAHTPLQGWETS